MKNKNSGFSLVELLVSIAILAVVSLGVVMFMTTTSNSYSRTSADLDLQTEAQLVANSFIDLIIDCEKRVNDTDQVLSGYDFDDDGSADTKTFTKGHVIEICNNYTQYLIVWNDTNQKVYYVEKEYNKTTGIWPTTYDGSKCQLLAENVSAFNLDLTKFVKERIVGFTLTYTMRGKSYTGNYQVHLRNDVQYNAGNIYTPTDVATITGIEVTPNPATIINKQTTSIQFVADPQISGSGTFDSNVTWDIVGSDTGCVLDTNTEGLLKVTGPLNTKQFKVRATSVADPTKIGVATVNVKKVEAISPVTTGGITSKNENDLPCTTKLGTVSFVPEVSGWNLTSDDCQATWKLEYKANATGNYQTVCYFDTNSKTYKTYDSNIATLAGSSTSASVKMGANVGLTYQFRLTAISKMDSTISGSTEFGISTKTAEFNGQIVRGAYINLNDYYKANGIQGDTVMNIVSIKLIQATNYDEATNSLFYCKDGILYLNYDAFKYTNSQSLEFFNGQNLQMLIKYKDPTGSVIERTVNFWFPATVITATPTPGNIVLMKGNIKNFNLTLQGFNITKKSHIGIYVYDDDVNVAGNENINPYISAAMTSGVGTAYSPVTTASVKLSTNTSTKTYPTEGIPFTIAVKSYYEASAGSRPNAYQTFKIYIANVEGANIFIPGKGSTESNVPANVTTTYKTFITGPASTSVQIKKNASGIWVMTYNNNTYEFEETYKYWVKTN